jgi:D-alanine-D-alanine ligase
VAFDKYSGKSYLRGVDYVKLAPDAFYRKGEDVEAFSSRAVEQLGLPLFVKPTAGGSSFGITRVTRAEDLPAAVRYALTEGDTVIVEKGVRSEHELTCAVYCDGGEVKALPVIEIISETGWFDYDAKYNGQVQEITPARIPEDIADRVRKITSHIYDILHCNGIIRIDYIVSKEGKISMLEVNTTPGMTATSFIPQQVKAAGLSMTEVLTEIVENQFI